MGELNQAAELAKGLSKQLRALIVVGDALGEIHNLEERAQEALNQAGEALASRADAVSMLEEKIGQLEAADRVLAERKAQVASVVPDAEAAARKIVNDAHREADKIVTGARDAEAKLREDTEARIQARKDAADAELGKLLSEVEKLKVSRDTLAAEISALRARLEGV